MLRRVVRVELKVFVSVCGFTRPLVIPSDVSAAFLKRSFTFVSHFKLKKVIVF